MRSLIALLTLAFLAGGPLAAVAQDAKKDAKKAEKKTEKKEEKAPPKVVLSAAEKAAVAAIKKLGGSVLEVAQNDGRLDVAYHLADGKIGDKQLEPLKKIKHIHSLNLRGTEVTDAAGGDRRPGKPRTTAPREDQGHRRRPGPSQGGRQPPVSQRLRHRRDRRGTQAPRRTQEAQEALHLGNQDQRGRDQDDQDGRGRTASDP
ncbi:MAG: hypothetical protein Ct9H300mP1_21690 [Planctomycetaceae bacterium]|nr:MAG: hypothetical protein Ct9H300mP1_21690 [Planctomycetaceae bacterium]